MTQDEFFERLCKRKIKVQKEKFGKSTTVQYAGTATFFPDSRLIALSSWGKGEIWPVDKFRKA